MIPQAKRVRVFAGGFFIGCLLAAGLALYRGAVDPAESFAPLPVFEVAVDPIELPTLPFEHEEAFRTWIAPETGEIRWLVQDVNQSLWRVSLNGEEVEVVRAGELQVDGNQGIETPALRAGLEHNDFEILSFAPLTTIFVVKVNPFEPNSIEESVRLLKSRSPYIIDAAPIPYGSEKLSRLETNFN